MPLTAYAQQKLGDHATARTAWTMPTTVYLALFTASPGENGSLTSEIAGGAYARQAITATMAAANATTGVSTNSGAVTFPAPTATWGMVSHVGLVDALTGGNVLFYAPISNPRSVNNGDAAVVFDAGSIAVSIAGSVPRMATSYLMKKLVDHLLGKAAFTMPTNIYLGLFASDPTIAGTQSSEVGVGGYVRQLLTGIQGAFDATTGISINATDVTFPDPTAAYPTVNFTAVLDAASAGNMLFASQLPSALVISAGAAAARFPAGSHSLTFG